MARRKTGDKESKIRRAAISQVAEIGSSAVSVNDVAKRAGLAVGTLYRYFENKDVLLRSAYLAVKTEIHAEMMRKAGEETTSKAKIRAMWFALLEYSYLHPQSFAFVEVIMNSTLLSDDEMAEVNAMSVEATAVVIDAIQDGTLRPGTAGAISVLLIAPALQIGRQSSLRDLPLDLEHVEEIFTLCWRAIAK